MEVQLEGNRTIISAPVGLRDGLSYDLLKRSNPGAEFAAWHFKGIKGLAGIDGPDWMVDEESTCPC